MNPPSLFSICALQVVGSVPLARLQRNMDEDIFQRMLGSLEWKCSIRGDTSKTETKLEYGKFEWYSLVRDGSVWVGKSDLDHYPFLCDKNEPERKRKRKRQTHEDSPYYLLFVLPRPDVLKGPSYGSVPAGSLYVRSERKDHQVSVQVKISFGLPSYRGPRFSTIRSVPSNSDAAQGCYLAWHKNPAWLLSNVSCCPTCAGNAAWVVHSEIRVLSAFARTELALVRFKRERGGQEEE